MPNPRRTWTADEDELIRSQPLNGTSLWKLEKMLHAKVETIEWRALELGVDLVRSTRGRKDETMSTCFQTKPVRVPEPDLLLERLRRFHG